MSATRKCSFTILCIALCFAAVFIPSHAEAADEITRIGIMGFANRTRELNTGHIDSITDNFTRMLSNSRSIAVVERQRLDTIGREQRFQMSGLVDPNTAVKIGRIAGCQYILLGAVTKCDYKESMQAFGDIYKKNEYELTLTIDMRIVDVTTSEVALSMAESGGVSVSIEGSKIIGTMEQKKPTLNDLIPHAITNTVSKLSQRLREDVFGEYSHVLSVSGRDVTISAGASSGARKGGRYLVYADGSEILDMNGRPLGRKRYNLAVVKINELYNEYSVARLDDNRGKLDIVRRGDKVTPITGGEAESLAKNKAFMPSRPLGLRSSGFDSEEETNRRISEMAGTSSGSVPAAVSVPSSSAAKGVTSPKREQENKSTDPAKVISTYGLSSGEANTRRIAHINAGKLRDKKQAYDKYVELATSYSGDYLAAYKAGEMALQLKKKNDAKMWFDKALSINPNYEPAQMAKTKARL